MWERLGRTRSEIEAAELIERGTHEHTDSERIDCCAPGAQVKVAGMVRAISLRPRSRVPALEIELYDGSGSVNVVWLGRRRIPGIEPGRMMRVTGRLTGNASAPTIYNPMYELLPTHA